VKKETLLYIALILTLLNTFPIRHAVASDTVIQVSPKIKAAQLDKSFNMTIDIVDATAVYSWALNLTWDPTVLTVTDVYEGDFLRRVGEVYTTQFHAYIFNDKGYTLMVCFFLGAPRSASAYGEGTLATVTFHVETEGNTALQLLGNGTQLLDYDILELPYTLKHGYFTYSIPKLYVDPSSVVNSSLVPGSTFEVNTSILDADAVYGWMFNLTWDPTVLNVTDVYEGDFLNQAGTQTTAFDVKYLTAGTICVNCTLVDHDAITANGNGTLAIIVFSVENYGKTNLDLNNTKLFDSKLATIPHVIEGGYFLNIIYDITVKNIKASIYSVEVGDILSINVTVKNNGNLAATFYVEIWANISLLEKVDVTNLASDDQKTLTFNWDTQNIAEGKYVIKAEAEILPDETHIDDNTLIMESLIEVAQPEQESPTSQIIIAVASIIIILLVAVMLYYAKRKRSIKM